MTNYTEALDHQMTLSSRLRNDRFTKNYAEHIFSFQSKGMPAEFVGHALKNSHTYYVTEEMCDLVSWAWRDMPSHPIEKIHLPSPYGWAWLEKPYVTTDVRGEPVSHRALSWMQVNDGRLLAVVYYGDMDFMTERETENLSDGVDGKIERMRHYIGRVHPVHILAWPFGEDWYSNSLIEKARDLNAADGYDPDLCEASHRESFGWLTAFFAIMGQELGRPDPVAPPRSTRKQAERGGKEDTTINVVHLRRRHSGEPEGSDDGEGTKRKMTVRTYVRPFWRRQWYPKDQVHRLILIPPHVRGPEGAPWSKTKTVKVVDR